MDTLISQLENLDVPDNDVHREELKNAVDKLQLRLKSPKDTLLELFTHHLHTALIRIGVELGLFKHMVDKEEESLSVDLLAEELGASSDILVRILRLFSSSNIIDQTGPCQFRANKMTRLFASPVTEAVVIHTFDVSGPAVQAFPSFLADTDYREITSSKSTPFQKGFNTDLSVFDWLSQHPKLLGAVQTVFTAFQSSQWLGDFKTLDHAVNSYLDSGSFEAPFFVDVGGGQGHQSIALRDKYPELAKKNYSIVLQDLHQTIKDLQLDGVKVMPHDFLTKQPMTGARIYYLRRILHDWPDDTSTTILSHLATSMSEHSMILIDEVILPEMNVPWFAAMADLNMMISFGARERSEGEWNELACGVGLRIIEIHRYSETGMGVLVLAK